MQVCVHASRRESPPVDLAPEEQECPVGQHAWQERDHPQRWSLRLDQPGHVVSPVLAGGKVACPRPAGVDRPPQAEARAWRGDTVGLDGVARLGEWRYRHHGSMPKLHAQLQAESQRSSSLQEGALRGEVFGAVVSTVAQHDAELIRALRRVDGIVLALAGVQSDKSHAPLSLV